MEIKEFYTENGQLSLQAFFIEPQILSVKVVGFVDEKVAIEISGFATHLFESEGLQGIISDASQGDNISPEAIKIMAQSDAFQFVKRVGVYGITKPIFKIGLEAVIKASGRDNIKVFDTQAEALAYAKGEDGS
jgi:hypothetical protein